MSFPLMFSPRDLVAQMFSGRPPVLIDIRIPEDIAADPRWFPAAHRLPFAALDAQRAAIGGASGVVVVCHGGLKLSQGVAGRLRRTGIAAAALTGGVLGWRAAGLPMGSRGPGLWVAPWTHDAATAAAIWAATRLLPQPQEVLTVAPDQISAAAERFGGAALPDLDGIAAQLDGPMPGLDRVRRALDRPDLPRIIAGLSRNCHGERAWQAGAFGVLDALAHGGMDAPGEAA